MRAALLLLALAGCQLAAPSLPDAAPEPLAATPPAAVRAAAVALEPEPPLDTLARTARGGETSVDSFRALVARVDTSTASGVELLRGSGAFHGDEVSARAGERWQGLYPTARGVEVRSFEVGVETVRDEVVDPEAGPFTGRRVVTPFSLPDAEWEPYGADPGDGSLALVRAERPFPEGPVPTAFVGGWAIDSSPLDLTLGGADDYRLSVVLGPEVVPGVRGERVVMLSDGSRDQPLTHLVDRDAAHPALQWAGDLDGDGRLDLLLDESWHYNLSLATLYLSGAAEAGALVRRVARHETTGC